MLSRVGDRAQNPAHRAAGSENEPGGHSSPWAVAGLEGDAGVSSGSAMPGAQQDGEMEGSPRRKGKSEDQQTPADSCPCASPHLRSEPAHQQEVS